MSAQAFEKLQVLMTGVDAAIARDVARMIVSEGGSVVAADRDAAKLTRLERDLGLYRASIETAQIDLASPAEVRLWEASLSAFGRLPHLMICCCADIVGRGSRETTHKTVTQPKDVALSEHKARNCPAVLAERILQPTLFLHAEALRHSAFDRAIAVVRHPTLRGVLARTPARGVFNPAGLIPYVRIASQVYSVRRQLDGETTRGGRLRLVPPSDKPSRRASAA
jgi:NAD(P)-dependent dehydrogenase (short-subunit alcohol dehydrogenase family)